MKNNIIYILLIFFLVIISFALNSLDNEFVYDDIGLVKDSQDQGLITDINENIFAYRPVRHLSYMLDFQIFGGSPAGYRFMNILYHGLASVFVFLLFNLITSNKITALLTSLIFAIHPVQTESVIYISGRRDILVGLFLFLTFYLILLHRQKKKNTLYLILFPFTYILGIFSKENAAVLPGILLIYDIFSKLSPDPENLKNRIIEIYKRLVQALKQYYLQYIILFSITLPFAFYNLFIKVPVFKEGIQGDKLNTIKSLKIFFMYIYKTFFPAELAADYSYNTIKIPRTFSMESLFYILLMLILFFILFKWVKRKPFNIFYFFLFFLPLFPVLHILVPYHVIFADHQLYISVAGFGLLFAGFIYNQLFLKGRKKLFYILITSLLVFYFTRTIIRNADWKNSFTLWSATVKTNPDCARAHNNLGTVFLFARNYDNAIAGFSKAIQIEPTLIGPYINIVTAYFEKKEMQKGIEMIKTIHKIAPDDFETFFTLGNRCLQYNLPETAIEEFLWVIELNPGYAPAYINLSHLYSQKDMFKEAVLLLENGIKSCKPSEYYHWLYYKLASNYLKQNNIDMAVVHLENTIKAAPLFHLAYIDMGNILLNRQKYPEAYQYYIKAYNIAPADIITLNMAGYTAVILKKFPEAELYLNRSINIKMTPQAIIYKSLLYAVQMHRENLLNILQKGLGFFYYGTEREMILEEIRKNPVFNFIRNDAEFKRMMGSY